MHKNSTCWYCIAADDAIRILETGHKGLSSKESTVRLQRYGQNKLQTKKKASLLAVFFRQFINPLVYILFAAAVVKAFAGGVIDAAAIMVVLLLMAAVGFIQEARAEKAMAALMQIVSPKAKIRRDGTAGTVPAAELVPGDIILLEAGDKIPADGRLVSVSSCKVNEAALTGESMPVDKHTDPVPNDTPVADKALRVLAVGYAEYTKAHIDLTEEDIKGRLVIAGLSGMIDPPREEAKQAIRLSGRAYERS